MAEHTGDAASLQSRVQRRLDAGDVAGGVSEALRALGPEILRFLRSVLRDEEDAADAFSQFAENLWKGLPGFRGQSSLRTWAFRVAWNSAMSLRNDAWHRHGRRFATGEASRIAEEIRTKTVVRVERQRDALEKLRQTLSPTTSRSWRSGSTGSSPGRRSPRSSPPAGSPSSRWRS